jgi:hypothetical protein
VERVVGLRVVLLELVFRLVLVVVVVVGAGRVERSSFLVDQLERHTERVVAEAVWMLEVHHKGLRVVLVLLVW